MCVCVCVCFPNHWQTRNPMECIVSVVSRVAQCQRWIKESQKFLSIHGLNKVHLEYLRKNLLQHWEPPLHSQSWMFVRKGSGMNRKSTMQCVEQTLYNLWGEQNNIRIKDWLKIRMYVMHWDWEKSLFNGFIWAGEIHTLMASRHLIINVSKYNSWTPSSTYPPKLSLLQS